MTPCMDVYRTNTQSDGILDKLKLIIVVIVYLQNKYLIGNTWSPTASMRKFKYLLPYAFKNKARLYHLGFIGSLLQGQVKIKYL